jgi:quercetin dioxygenase-like cupin family protein
VIKAKDPSRTLVARFTVQPGAQFPWHTHAGPVIVNVTRGALVYVDADDCVERTYPAGTAFVDSGHGHVHTALNRTGEETELVATFFEAPAEGSLPIPAAAPADCNP